MFNPCYTQAPCNNVLLALSLVNRIPFLFQMQAKNERSPQSHEEVATKCVKIHGAEPCCHGTNSAALSKSSELTLYGSGAFALQRACLGLRRAGPGHLPSRACFPSPRPPAWKSSSLHFTTARKNRCRRIRSKPLKSRYSNYFCDFVSGRRFSKGGRSTR